MLDEISIKREQLAGLCRQHHVLGLALFGSSLREDFSPSESDIDLVVEFEALTPGEYAENYFSFQRSLASLFDRRVDLVSLRSVRNPYFLREIEATKVNLYAA